MSDTTLTEDEIQGGTFSEAPAPTEGDTDGTDGDADGTDGDADGTDGTDGSDTDGTDGDADGTDAG
jgi:hypothetical protein